MSGSIHILMATFEEAHKIIKIRFVTIACMPTATLSPPAWTKPELPAALGFLVMQRDQRDFCFAIACPDKTRQLVNVSPGGGPFGNPDSGVNDRDRWNGLSREPRSDKMIA